MTERVLGRSVRELLSLDLRSLALFRVGLAATLLYDLLDRASSLVAHYTEEGVLPAEQALDMFGRSLYASIHYYLSGSSLAVACLFGLAALCGGALLVGYRTRLVSVLSWYLLVSLHTRNGFVNGMSGDALLVALLFWGMFLPLGERWSLDARRRKGLAFGNRVFCVATTAHIVQLCVLYFTTGLLKSGEAWSNGSAVHYALHLGHFATPFTQLLQGHDGLLRFLTHATRVFEIAGPLLLFVPLFRPAARMLAIVLFTGFHLGLALFLNVGAFPIICIVAWLALVPGALFDEWLPRLRPALFTQRDAGQIAPPERGVRRLIDWALVLPLAFVVVQGVVKLGWLDLGNGRELPPIAASLGTLTRMNQNWGMFSPEPSLYTLWLGVEGQLANGNSVDPFANTPVPRSIPDDIAGASRSYRWRAYTWTALLTRPTRPTLGQSHSDFAAFLCREWNASHAGPERLLGLRSIGFWRQTGPTGAEDLRPSVLYEHQCDGAGKLLWSAARPRENDPSLRR